MPTYNPFEAVTAWLRILRGYPVEDGSGGKVYPGADAGTTGQLKLLSAEADQARAELGSLRDRVATLERIITDEGYRLTQEIDNLRAPRN